MTDPFHADDHATPLTPTERDGLIPTHVTLRGELNELEQKNIAEADSWAFARKRGVLGEPFLLGLHRRMFRRVWRWAGKYRNSERNLGVKRHLIQPSLREAIDNAQYWVDHKSYEPDELAVLKRLPPSRTISKSAANRDQRPSPLGSSTCRIEG